MLSAELNELLCGVGPGAPMGQMLREYWWPVLRSEKLPPDGAPERVRLLGEDYAAFRATDGRVGVIDERCPHRGASMMLARNEACSLRCQQFESLDVALGRGSEALYAAGLETRDEPFCFSMRFTEGVCSGSGIPAWVPTVMPSWVFITAINENPFGDRAVLGHVPIDDENVMLVLINYNMEKPLGELAQRSRMGVTDYDEFVPPSHNRENNWSQDRAAMRDSSGTGIGMGMYSAGILLQDQAAIESMGRISDRTHEQIGPADHGIVKGRNGFIDAVRAHVAGKPALGVDQDLSGIGL